MKIKHFPAALKARGDDEPGVFEALVSVFGNKDSYGDVVVPGAFSRTLSEWASRGDPIPVYWSHRMDDPDYNIGQVVEARETDEGLWVKAQLDLESPKAAQVHRLLKGRRVTQFSFAYDVVDGGPVKRDGEEYYELRDLTLYEVGPTPIGANPETELLAVKAAQEAVEGIATAVKAGRVLAQKHIDSLRSAQEAIETVIKAAEANDQEKASGHTAPTEDEALAGKSSGERVNPSARVLAELSILSLG